MWCEKIMAKLFYTAIFVCSDREVNILKAPYRHDLNSKDKNENKWKFDEITVVLKKVILKVVRWKFKSPLLDGIYKLFENSGIFLL